MQRVDAALQAAESYPPGASAEILRVIRDAAEDDAPDDEEETLKASARTPKKRRPTPDISSLPSLLSHFERVEHKTDALSRRLEDLEEIAAEFRIEGTDP